MNNRFPTDFDPSLPLERASALAADWYVEPSVFEKELKRVFEKEWHWAGRLDQLQKPGSWLVTQVGKESVVVTRDIEGRLNAFSNVCRHRAARVCRKSEGQSTRLKCQYHGWTYDLAGNLKTTPEFDGVIDFTKEEQALPQFQVKVHGPWVFVCLSPEPPSFENQWAPLLQATSAAALDGLVFSRRVEYPLQCNWKVFVDNYLDGGYHINTLHPDLAGVIPYAQYRSEVFARSSLQSAPLKPASGAGVSQVRKGSAQYWWIYPNLMINIYDDTMDVNVVIPEGPHRCKVLFDFYFSRELEQQPHLIEASLKVAHQVQLEDQDICEEVQKGLESSFYRSGRFSVSREQTAYHFHQLIAGALLS